MNFAVVVFPGSNCEVDSYHVIKHVLREPVEYVWHDATDLERFDCIVLPGGFTYGDYLRCGAIARFSPVMRAVSQEAERGKLILGICNGFQILTECGMLPGALVRNAGLRFVCRFVHLRCENPETPFTNRLHEGEVLSMPIAHGEGQYVASPDTLSELRQNRQVVFRYCQPDGALAADANPNGSMDAIAGICNRRRNIFGLMPHPERCSEDALGGADGRMVFQSILSSRVCA